MSKFLARIAILILVAGPVLAQSDSQSSTTLGPRNLYLFDGAQALLAGDADEGVRLTLQGLAMAHGQREVKAGHANLCAGFLMLGQAETALVHCDWVLEHDEFHGDFSGVGDTGFFYVPIGTSVVAAFLDSGTCAVLFFGEVCGDFGGYRDFAACVHFMFGSVVGDACVVYGKVVDV